LGTTISRVFILNKKSCRVKLATKYKKANICLMEENKDKAISGLRQLRKISGKSIERISKETGISVPALYNAEKGKTSMTIDNYLAVIECLGYNLVAVPKATNAYTIALGDGSIQITTERVPLLPES
jgi:DNA-binding phage protein